MLSSLAQGLGGLISGNYLVKKGFKTLICEQHSSPGGYACGFSRGPYYFDGGVQSFCSCGILFPILEELGLREAIHFRKTEHRFIIPSHNFDMCPTSWGEIVQSFTAAFPSQAQALINLFSELEVVKDLVFHFSYDKAMPLLKGFEQFKKILSLMTDKTYGPHMAKMQTYSQLSAAELIRRYLGSSSELSDFLASLCYKNASVVSYAGMWNCYIQDYWYPEGGMQQFADTLANNFQKQGGEIRYSTRVEKILTHHKKTQGIVTNKRETIESRYVVYAGDLIHLYRHLLDSSFAPKDLAPILQGTIKPPTSESIVSLFLGLSIDPLKLKEQLKADHVYFSPTLPKTLPTENDGDYFKKTPIGVSASFLFDETRETSKSALIVQTMAPYDWHNFWDRGPQGERTEQYRQLKKEVTAALVETLERLLPGISTFIEYSDLATPLTLERYTLNTWGATAGWTWDINSSPVKPNQQWICSPLKNLFTCGHWTMTPGGVPTAALTGRMVAQKIR